MHRTGLAQSIVDCCPGLMTIFTLVFQARSVIQAVPMEAAGVQGARTARGVSRAGAYGKATPPASSSGQLHTPCKGQSCPSVGPTLVASCMSLGSAAWTICCLQPEQHSGHPQEPRAPSPVPAHPFRGGSCGPQEALPIGPHSWLVWVLCLRVMILLIFSGNLGMSPGN